MRSRFNYTLYGLLTLILFSSQLKGQAPANDNKANATILSQTADGVFDSGTSAYTLVGATADEPRPANWSYDVNHNVWFEFQPWVAATNITITGALADKMVAIYDENNNLIHSETGVGTAELALQLTGLDTEKKHYINVDAGTAGTFGVQLGFDNDLKANALPLTLVNGKYDSDNAAFTTVGATGDEPKPSRWGSNPLYNVWFSFKPQTSGNIRIDVKTGNEEGTLNRPRLVLLNNAGQELASNDYMGDGVDMGFSATGLVADELYFISVGNSHPYAHTNGTFTLSIDETASHDLKENPEVISSIDNYCSTVPFTTAIATGDGPRPSHWESDPKNNVWFEFEATSSGEVRIDAKTAGDEGTVARLRIALFKANYEELASNGNMGDGKDVGLSFTGLTPNETYLISVDSPHPETYRNGTFTLCIDDEASHDAKEKPLLIGSIDDVCLSGEDFNTVIATGDGARPSQWQSDPNHNLWFEFEATSSGEVRIDAKTGGAEGTVARLRIALFKANYEELASNGNMGDGKDVGLSFTGLTPNETYLISVDSPHPETYRNGTFTLCIDDEASHDAKEKPLLIGSIDDVCLSGEDFNTVIATGDGPLPSQWQSDPKNNLWFEFEATNSGEVRIDAKTGGDEGTVARLRIALFKANEELASNGNMGDGKDVGLSFTGLNPGESYLISVDSPHPETYRNGTFTLCIDDEASHDFREKAIVIDSPQNYESEIAEYTTVIGTPDGNRPANWSSDPANNVWFTFTAPVTGSLKVDARVFGSEGYGTLGRPRILVELADGTELGSIDYQADNSTTVLEGLSVVKDQQYYVSIDNQHPEPYRNGSFTLATRIVPDFLPGVTDLTAVIDNCGTGTVYNNHSAETNNPTSATFYHNEWFQLRAPDSGNLKVTLDLTTTGAISDARMILTDQSGINILHEVYHASSEGFLEISAIDLDPGDTYFLSVGSYNSHPNRKGTFGICLEDEVTFDYKDGAQRIAPELINNCANPVTYSNRWATTDNPTGTAIYNNVWFDFVAPNSGSVTVTLDLSAAGSISNSRMMLLKENNEVLAEVYHTSGEGYIEFSATDLDAGETYYLTVGSTHTHILRRGIFSLCLTDEATFDYKEGAEPIPSELINNCANPVTYSNRWATTDNPTDIAIYNNVWFDFIAPESGSVTVTLDLSASGSISDARMMLLNEDDEVLAEVYHTYGEGSIEFSVTNLDSDKRYYLTVGSTHTHILRRGIFSLCLTDEATFDYKEGAERIPPELINNCANPTTYTNRWATTDNPTGISIYNNVWFDFVAPESGSVTVTLDLSAVGSINDARMMLLNDKDEVLAEAYHSSGEGSIEFSATDLDSDKIYYLTVGSTHTHILRRGIFSLCLTDKASFDHKVGALDLTSQINNCENPQLLTNRWATADDGLSFSIANNVWFEWNTLTGGDFTLQLDLSATGSLGRARMVVLNQEGNIEAQIDNSSGAGMVELDFTDLPANQRYYVTVGSYDSHPIYRGSFSLCLSSPDIVCETELWAVASGDWNDPATWSTTEGGTPGGDVPCENTIVHIKGVDVVFTSGSSTVKRINISGQNVNVITGLTIQSGELNIKEEVKTSGPGIRLQVAQGAHIRVTGED